MARITPSLSAATGPGTIPGAAVARATIREVHAADAAGIDGPPNGGTTSAGAQTAPGEPFAKPGPAARQASLDGPDRAAELRGGLLAGQAFEVEQDDRRAVMGRQPVELLVELGPGLGVDRGRPSGRGRPRSAARLDDPAPCRIGPDSGGDAAGDAVEPARERAGRPDRPGAAGEDDERGLGRVVGVVRVAEHAPADVADHRSVPPDDRLERRLAPAVDEALQQLAVAQSRDRPVLEDRPQRPPGHLDPPSRHPPGLHVAVDRRNIVTRRGPDYVRLFRIVDLTRSPGSPRPG